MNMFDLNNYMADMVYEYIPNVKRVGSNKLNFRCPLCGDGKKSTSHRGWFYIDTGSYYCWNAGCIANGNGMQGLKFLSLISGKTIQEVKNELVKNSGSFQNAISRHEIKDMGISLFDDEEKHIDIHKYILDKIDLGEWQENLPKFVTQYIVKRKLLNAPFLPNDFKFYYDKKFKRLVIPWTDEYYQERIILASQKDENKYMFPPEVEKPIFGLENIDKNFKYIFLLEGVFDSIWVKNGLAVGSLHLSNHQRDMLREYEKDFKIIYMPDNQYKDKSARIETIKLFKERPYQNIFVWPKEFKNFKDVNETIIKSDKFIDIWKSEKFLTNNIMSGLKGLMYLRNI